MSLTRRQVLKGSAALTAAGMLGIPPLRAQTELIKKPIPKTGELIPVIGIGTNRYGVDAVEEQLAPLRETLKKFRELGGTVIDTAPAYRNSEAVLGDLIDGLGIRDDLFMATKCNMQTQEQSATQMEESVARLKWDVIDLMQVHNLMGWDGQLPAMREWKAAGRLRYYGVTTSQTQQHELLAKLMQEQELDFIQVNYSLGDRAAAEKILPLAADKGLGVFINVPLGRGSLFGNVGQRPLPEWAAEFDCKSWGQFFLKYIVSHPAVTVAIPGTRKPQHAEDNLGAAMGRLPDAAMRKRMEDFIDSV
ncbi:MAG: twin-arginine translocation signal domain-containing protein [Gammaproteobacteria bacterium]|nr:MAG: twin-arginine translocation signal domain-containing protein [Gammaproteobacteria bacterium]